MGPDRRYFVYLMASKSRVLYVGMTNDLERRVWEHRSGDGSAFTKKYHVHKLVYFEETDDVTAAIEREKQLKGWKRERKVALIEAGNPKWLDLAEKWF